MLVMIGIAFFIIIYLLPKILSKYFKEKVSDNQIITITIVISFIFLVMTYLIALFFKNSNIIERVGSADAWIGFAGSIMGGFITMLALYFTLKENKKNHKRNHILSLKPYLVCNIVNEKDSEINYNNGIFNNGYIQCDICNPSNNIANEIRMIREFSAIKTENDRFLIVHNLFDKFGITVSTVFNKNAFFLAPNQSYNWKTNFGIKWDEEIKFKEATFTFKHTIVFEFSDSANLQKYHLNFECDLDVNIDKNNTAHLFLRNISNTINAID